MFCPNCGTKCDGMAFCPNCGTKLDSEELGLPPETDSAAAPNNAGAGQYDPGAEQPNAWAAAAPAAPQYTAPQYTAPQYTAPQYTAPAGGSPKSPSGTSPARLAVRSVAVSPLFLIAIIAFTIVSAITVYTEIQTVQQLGQYSSYLGTEGTIMLLAYIVLIICAVLMVVGLWMLYAGAWSHADGRMPQTGLNIIKVVQIVYLVLISALFIYVFIKLIELSSQLSQAGSYYGYSGYSSQLNQAHSILIRAFLFYGALLIILIFYYIGIFRSISSVSWTVVSGRQSGKVSVFVAICCFISALIAFIALVDPSLIAKALYEILGAGSMGGSIDVTSLFGVSSGGTTTVGTINAVAGIIASVCFGITILYYRAKLNAVQN